MSRNRLQTSKNNVNEDNQSVSQQSQQLNYSQQLRQQNANSPSPPRPTSPSMNYENLNSTYTPNDFYNNNTNSKETDKRDSSQKKIGWNHQLEQKQRQQIQKYQQYQQLQQNKPNDENHDHSSDTGNVDENGDSMAESVDKSITEQSTSSTTSSQTIFQKDPLEISTKLRSSDNKDQNIQDSVEMNVLNGKKDSRLSRTKSHRPRPHAAESSIPSSNNNDNGYFSERSNSPSILRMPTIMRGTSHAENPSLNSPPRRQKSLVRPERARNNYNYRGAVSTRQTYEGSDEESRFNAFSGTGGDDRRPVPLARRSSTKEPPRKKKWYKCQYPSCWVLFSRIVTFWAPSSVLSCCGMHDKLVQQAWREKIALVFIILILCIAVGFLTFGFQGIICGNTPFSVPFGHMTFYEASMLGRVYDLNSFSHKVIPPYVKDQYLASPVNGFGRSDLTFLFQSVNFECKNVLIPNQSTDGLVVNYFPCVPVHENETPKPDANPNNAGCHIQPYERVDALKKFKVIGEVHFEWSDISNPGDRYVVYNGQVLNLDLFQWKVPNIILPDSLINLINDENGTFHGRDVTHYLYSDPERIKLAKCLETIVKVGSVDPLLINCLITNAVTYVSLFVIVSVVMVRFFLAVLFGWIFSWRLGSFREETAEDIAKRRKDIERWSNENNHFHANARDSRQSKFLNKSRFSSLPPPGSAPFVDRRRHDSRMNSRLYSIQPGEKNFNSGSTSSLLRPMSTNGYNTAMIKDSNGSPKMSQPSSIINENQSRANSMSSTSSSTYGLNIANESRFNFPLLHTIMLVTCYSEGRQGIRTTLNSLANTDYPASHKLIMIIADGVIFGAGNELSTPDICLSLMTDLVVPINDVMAHSYVAIADGKKRHNMAKVYAGYYKCKDQNEPNKFLKIPMVTIVKCGGPDEQDDKKPGNRGKRDSQMILMSFLQKVMFDERMTPLEYEFFNSIRAVTGVTPDQFEIVLMVDADTKIYPDSVTRMAASMARDSLIMGLCGETKIANKSDSWVTMIQVFEYYISHHLQKAFESIFGGVTCLPGCFCMYRIKAPKGPNGYWVPILANPDIVEQYSENIINTLHKKNLLLLGEDRYLSTLMLRTFPKRKMVFVPQAVCKTIVPDTFRVLRSQRRRWINSTVHNLLELVLIPDLCGTFCFSMQFVIFMELVGTVVLPAAITFTFYVIIISFIKKPIPYLPLGLLAIVLGLPAILILLTTRKIIYVGWMLIYLFSLPIWNFILPLYAYWHFDDFSWGQTRKVEGEIAGADHSRKEGEFDSTKIVMKRWAEWEREKQLKFRSSSQQQISSVLLSPEEGFSYSRSTMNGGSEKSSYHLTPSPLNPISTISTTVGKRNTGIGMKTKNPTDSLMIPPPLSNSSPDPFNSTSTLTVGIDTIAETDYQFQHNIISRSNNTNSTNTNYDNNENNYLPNNSDKAYLQKYSYDSL